MAIYRVFSDADGESHIGDLSLAGAGLGKRMPEVRVQCGERDGGNGGQQGEIMAGNASSGGKLGRPTLKDQIMMRSSLRDRALTLRVPNMGSPRLTCSE